MNTFNLIQESFDGLYDMLSIPVVLFDNKFRLIKVNQSFLDLTKATLDDLKTHSMTSFFRELKAYADGTWSLRELIKDYVGEIVDAHGNRIPVRVNFKKLNNQDGSYGGLLGFITDLSEINTSEEKVKRLTIENEVLKDQLAGEVPDNALQERKRLKQEIKGSEEFLEHVLESRGDGMIITAGDGKIIRINESFAKILGKEKKETEGTFIWELGPMEGTFRSTTGETITLDQSYRDCVSSRIEKIAQLEAGEKIDNWEYYAFNKNGDIIPLELTLTIQKNSDGTIIGGVGSVRDITERKKAEKEIKESKDFLDNIFKTTADGIIVTDNNGHIVKLNRAVEKITGYRENELIGKLAMEMSPLDEEHRKTGINMMKQLYEKGFLENWEHEWYRKDGSLCPIEFNLALLKDPEGNLLGSVAAIRDITERKRSEEAIRMSEERYRNLIEYANDAIISANKDGIITDFNKKAEVTYGYHREELLGNSALLLVAPCERKQQREFLEKFRKSKEYRIVKKPIMGKHVRKDGKEFPVESSFSSSIVHGNHTFTAFVRDITERKRTEDELRETRDHLDNIIESSLDAIVVTDPTGYVTKANNSFMKLLGYKQGDLIGKNFMEFTMLEKGTYESTTGELVEINEESFNNLTETKRELYERGKISNWEVYLLRKDNKAVPCEANVVFLYNHEGDITGGVGINRDITERKKAEKEIKESRDFLENIYKTTADGIIATDNNGYIMRVNRAVEKITGYRENELIGKHIMEMSPLDEGYRKAGAHMVEQLFEKGYVENWEHLWYRKDGSLCPVEFNITFLKDPVGNLSGLVAAIRDITERKKSEEALKMSEERYHNLIEYANDAFISANEEGIITTVNKKAEDMYGYSREELLGKSVFLLMALSERELQREGLEKFKKSREFIAVEKPIEGNHVKKDGREFPVESSISVLEMHGKYTFTSFTRDITERKRAEKALKNAHDELEKKVDERTADLKIANEQLEKLIESSLDSIVVTDPTGYITRVNKSFIKLLGYTEEEILGKHTMELAIAGGGIYESTTGELIELNEESLPRWGTETTEKLYEEGEMSNWENYYLRKDGKIVPIEINIALLHNEGGDIIGTVGINRDITERKLAENALKKAYDELEKRVEERTADLKIANEQLEKLIESSLDSIVVTDPTGYITRANKSFMKLLGYNQEEVIGKYTMELSITEEGIYESTTGELVKIDEEFLNSRIKLNMEKMEKIFEEGKITNWEGYYLRKDGIIVPVEVNVAFIYDEEGDVIGSVGINRDITERKRTEKQLRETKDYLDNIIDSSLDAIVVTDSSIFFITRANNSFMKLLGYKQEEIIGKHMVDISITEEGTYESTTGELVEINNDYLEMQRKKPEILFEEGKISNWESYWLRKDGKIVPVETNVSFLYNEEGDIIGAVGINRDITARKKSEKEIRESKDFLENIFKTTGDGIIVTDNNGYIMRANRSLEKITGYREDELIGKHVMELSPLGEEHKKAAADMLKQLYEKGYVENWEQDCYRKDGSLCPIETNITFLSDREGNPLGSVGAIRDITERKWAEKKINETKDHLDNVIKSSLDPIVVTDPTGCVTRTNNSFLKLLGYKQEELIGKNMMEFALLEAGTYESTTGELVEINEERCNNTTEAKDSLFEEGKISNWQSHLIRKDNKVVPVEINISYLYNEEGEVTGSVGISRDITERKKAEKAIQEANRCRNDFFTNISHEFRTPLTLTMGPIEGILRDEYGKINGNLKKQLSLSLKNSRKLLKLINQLLEFSRLESGSQNLIYEKRNLKEFIATILDSFSFIAKKKNINLTFSHDDGTNGVYIDPVKMEKVMFNLIGNAFKFTPEGGSITVKAAKDQDSGDNGNGHLEISVKDTGIGLKKEQLTYVFERFRQADGGTAREHGGTGIGLALSKELVDLMGGTIEVESEYGKGSTFSVHLPLVNERITNESKSFNGSEGTLSQQVEIELSDFDLDQEEKCTGESISGNKPLILIIDDNLDVRHYLSGILKKDYDIATAQNGIEGLKKLEEHTPDLILCDIMMPKMDGYEFLRRVKSNPTHRHIPLIFLTAKADTEMKIEGLEEGADDYIVKPFNSLELRARVKALLRIRSLIKENKDKEKKIINLTQKLEGKYRYGNIIGNTTPMRKIYQLLESIKESDSTILITGETGTGKELFANAIHYNSPRKDYPMISVNCGAIPRELMEREFFGHVKGAYTGAHQNKKGYFEEAHGGTLFLDEIGELDKDLQVKLLRALESGEITRVGATEPTKVDVRLIAASNKDLRAEVQKGNFREDLYYRIYVIPIHVPPLRERKEDIPLLIEHFLKDFQTRLKTKIPSLSEKEMSLFMNYPYPGNVRELEHIIERFCLLGRDAKSLFNIPLEGFNKLSLHFSYEELLSSSTNPLKAMAQKAKLYAERDFIKHALKICDNNHNKAARLLKIGRSSFYRKMKEIAVNDLP